MVIKFSDDKFPKKLKNKFYVLEDFLNESMKIKSYNFKYDTDYNFFIIYLRFEFFDINIKFNYEDFIYLKIDDIYNKITKQVEVYSLKYIYK